MQKEVADIFIVTSFESIDHPACKTGRLPYFWPAMNTSDTPEYPKTGIGIPVYGCYYCNTI
jgi:hypothetical protein